MTHRPISEQGRAGNEKWFPSRHELKDDQLVSGSGCYWVERAASLWPCALVSLNCSLDSDSVHVIGGCFGPSPQLRGWTSSPQFLSHPWDLSASLSQWSFLFLSKSSEASHSCQHFGFPAREQERGSLIHCGKGSCQQTPSGRCDPWIWFFRFLNSWSFILTAVWASSPRCAKSISPVKSPRSAHYLSPSVGLSLQSVQLSRLNEFFLSQSWESYL